MGRSPLLWVPLAVRARLGAEAKAVHNVQTFKASCFRFGGRFDRVHRHRQHRIITDAGRQLHILIGSQPFRDRLRQRFIDAILAQQLPSEVDDLQVIGRNAIRNDRQRIASIVDLGNVSLSADYPGCPHTYWA